jgi:long-chain acyl-CoA synthetase
VRTGDLARRGFMGTAVFAGRKKDVILNGGYTVYPREVEATLEEHPDVVEAAVVGIPDGHRGEVPAAAVRLADDASVTTDDLVAWVAERLSDYKAPRRILAVDEFPTTGTQKLRRQELADLFDDGA